MSACWQLLLRPPSGKSNTPILKHDLNKFRWEGCCADVCLERPQLQLLALHDIMTRRDKEVWKAERCSELIIVCSAGCEILCKSILPPAQGGGMKEGYLWTEKGEPIPFGAIGGAKEDDEVIPAFSKGGGL